MPTMFLIDETLETCFNDRTVVWARRSTGDADTAAAAKTRVVTKNMVQEETNAEGKGGSLRGMIGSSVREERVVVFSSEARSDLQIVLILGRGLQDATSRLLPLAILKSDLANSSEKEGDDRKA